MDHQLKSPCLKYRKDIDGLRAVAILIVVFFHVFNFGGGFVGVDVFFVISGFLISTIIFKGLDSGNFSFADFYARRTKRIFPALLLIFLFSMVAGWFVLFPIEYINLNKTIFRASYFVANFHFLKQSSDYFNNAADVIPLLHLWSLSVEEQFYVVWPLVLWILYRFRIDVLKFAVVMAIASFSFCLYKTFNNQMAAFFLPQSRFWELLIGAILARVNERRQQIIDCLNLGKVTEQKFVNYLSFVGVTLLIVAVMTLTKDKNFPGAWALLPTVGTALIIFAGSQAWFNKNILQNSILVWFGLISFPLYLWHWPLLSFLEIIENKSPTLLAKFLIVLLSILLSWLTYKFVETPIRFGNHSRKKVIALSILMILFTILAGCLYRTNAVEVYKKDARDLMRSNSMIWDYETCSSFNIDRKGIICLANSPQPNVLIVGDSHATALNSSAYLKKSHLSTLTLSANSCLPFDKYAADHNFGDDDCRKLSVQIENAVKNIASIKTVMISTYSPQESDFAKYDFFDPKIKDPKSIFLNGYSDFVAKLIALGKNVIFVVDVPKLEQDPKKCVARIFKEVPAYDCKVAKSKVLENEKSYRKIIEEIKRRNPQMILFYSSDVFCDSNHCHGKTSDNLFYYDKHHLSVSGSKKLLNAIAAKHHDLTKISSDEH